jgi:hypothetical protein
MNARGITPSNPGRIFCSSTRLAGVAVPKDFALANILAETPGWKPIYCDAVAVVLTPTRVMTS